MTRDDFDEKIKETARRRVNGICSNPSCKNQTQGPSVKDSNKVQYIGVVSHICAASERGPRYNPDQTSEERKSINNAIFLCSTCSVMVDKNKGADYPESILKNWKEQSEKEALDSFNKQIIRNGWNVINFTNLEENYSSALTGVGLSQKHVKTCPRFETTIEEIKTNLELNYNSCLYGVSGSGKSITAYQIAFDYYNDGYEVLKLKNTYKDENITIPTKDKIFLIIDNAHNISEELISDICSKTNITTLALFVSSSEIYKLKEINNDTTEIEHIINPLKSSELQNVELNINEAISVLKEFYLKNINTLLPYVKKLDSRIGDNYMEEPLERRIDVAFRQNKNTPWLFNYVLTGGWKTAYRDVENLKNNNRADILMLIIAFWQIFSLDKGIDTRRLKETALIYSDSNEWFSNSIKILNVKKLIVFESGYIKLKHIEYAQRVLASFDEETDAEIVTFLMNLAEYFLCQFEQKRATYNLLKCLQRYWNRKWFLFKTKKKDLLRNLALSCIDNESYDEYNLYLLETILSYNRNSETINLINSNELIIQSWIKNADHKTAYSLSVLLNSFINERENFNKSIINVDESYAIKLGTIIKNLGLGDELYFWGSFVDRLAFFVSQEWAASFINNISSKTFEIKTFRDLLYHQEYVKLLKLDLDIALKDLAINTPQLVKLFNEDCIIFYNNYHEAFWRLLGSGPLEFRANTKQKRAAKLFIKKLNADNIVNRLNTIKKREIRTLGEILLFIALFDEGKYNEIVATIDFEYFASLIKFDNFSTFNDEDSTLTILSHSKYGLEQIRKIFADNIDKIKVFPKKLCYIIPDLIAEEITKDKTKTVNLQMSCISWDRGLEALVKLKEHDKEITKKIVIDNLEEIIKAVYLPQNNHLEEAVEFLCLTENLIPDIENILFIDFDIKKAEKSWTERLRGKIVEKRTASKVIDLALKSDLPIKEIAYQLRRKYPKSSNLCLEKN